MEFVLSPLPTPLPRALSLSLRLPLLPSIIEGLFDKQSPFSRLARLRQGSYALHFCSHNISAENETVYLVRHTSTDAPISRT